MRRLFIYTLSFAVIVIAYTSLTGCQGCVEEKVAVTESEAEIRFDTIAHDFGDIPMGEKREYEFVFHNIGNQPLVIQDVNTTCGCIKEFHTVRPVMPGRSGSITAIYDEKYPAPGHFHKGVGVHSNGKTGFIMLKVSGEVKPTKNEK